METIKAEEPLGGSSLFVLPLHKRLTPLFGCLPCCVRHTLLERVVALPASSCGWALAVTSLPMRKLSFRGRRPTLAALSGQCLSLPGRRSSLLPMETHRLLKMFSESCSRANIETAFRGNGLVWMQGLEERREAEKVLGLK